MREETVMSSAVWCVVLCVDRLVQGPTSENHEREYLVLGALFAYWSKELWSKLRSQVASALKDVFFSSYIL